METSLQWALDLETLSYCNKLENGIKSIFHLRLIMFQKTSYYWIKLPKVKTTAAHVHFKSIKRKLLVKFNLHDCFIFHFEACWKQIDYLIMPNHCL